MPTPRELARGRLFQPAVLQGHQSGQLIHQIVPEGPPPGEPARRRRNPRSNSTGEVAANPPGDVLGAAIPFEALDVQPGSGGALPEMRVVDSAPVEEQRIPEQPEPIWVLQRRRLRCGMKRRRSRSLCGERKVARADRQRQPNDLRPRPGAARTCQVEVDDRPRARTADVIAGTDRRDRCAAEVLVQAAEASRASKIRFAPGTSSGVGAAYDQATSPSEPTRTSERLACPRSAISAP